jgi:hypothetical protein
MDRTNNLGVAECTFYKTGPVYLSLNPRFKAFTVSSTVRVVLPTKFQVSEAEVWLKALTVRGSTKISKLLEIATKDNHLV